ncbi:hypothetical protein EB796_005183 [Bugula neritina]|uniref:Uncharacterized protein n=1 Tax=Bugula neritina TaxID=10212 RepID=A0A7J7KDZ4_BUGNE|nr:hypothetical protein EB796_005183 [Bugula neritina]
MKSFTEQLLWYSSFLIVCRFSLADLTVKDILYRKESACIAELSTNAGTKWIYLKDDHTRLKNNPYYNTTPTDESPTYMWRPCVPFDIEFPSSVSQSSNFCHQTYVARNINDRVCHNLGQEGTFAVANGSLELHYINRNNSKEKATVRLTCHKSQSSGYLKCISGCRSYSPVLEYTSKYVCLNDKPNSRIPLYTDHDFSPGSLVLITSAFIFSVYLIVGLIRGTVKGRSGCDRLPNSDFWMELPLLVRDGCRFIFLCRLPRHHYHFLKKKSRNTDIYAPIVYDDRTPVVDI